MREIREKNINKDMRVMVEQNIRKLEREVELVFVDFFDKFLDVMVG